MRTLLWSAGLVGVLVLVFNGFSPASTGAFNGMAIGILLICGCLIGLFLTPKERRV